MDRRGIRSIPAMMGRHGARPNTRHKRHTMNNNRRRRGIAMVWRAVCLLVRIGIVGRYSLSTTPDVSPLGDPLAQAPAVGLTGTTVYPARFVKGNQSVTLHPGIYAIGGGQNDIKGYRAILVS